MLNENGSKLNGLKLQNNGIYWQIFHRIIWTTMPDNTIHEPWFSLLKEIDDSLESEISFHCFGAFAITVQFGLPRETSDVDVMSGIVRDHYRNLTEKAGKDSPLHKKYGVYLDLVGAIASVPDDYEERLIQIDTPFEKIRFSVMEVHDIILAKISRNQPKDIQDVEYLARTADLDVALLEERYYSELQYNIIGAPERAEGTLRTWIDLITEIREIAGARLDSPPAWGAVATASDDEVVEAGLNILKERYHQELRTYLEREDLTLELWIEMIKESQNQRW